MNKSVIICVNLWTVFKASLVGRLEGCLLVCFLIFCSPLAGQNFRDTTIIVGERKIMFSSVPSEIMQSFIYDYKQEYNDYSFITAFDSVETILQDKVFFEATDWGNTSDVHIHSITCANKLKLILEYGIYYFEKYYPETGTITLSNCPSTFNVFTGEDDFNPSCTSYSENKKYRVVAYYSEESSFGEIIMQPVIQQYDKKKKRYVTLFNLGEYFYWEYIRRHEIKWIKNDLYIYIDSEYRKITIK